MLPYMDDRRKVLVNKETFLKILELNIITF